MRDNFGDLLSTLKLAEILAEKKEDGTCKKIVIALAIIGAIAAVAGIAYGVYKYLTPDYLEDFDEDFDEEFDEDFYDELEKEEAEKAEAEESSKDEKEVKSSP